MSMQITKDYQSTQRIYLTLISSLFKQAKINAHDPVVMSYIKRQSPVTQYPWATLANLQNRIFTEYFCNTDTFTLKAESKSKFGSHIKVKEVCNMTKNHNMFINEWNFRIPLGKEKEDAAIDWRVDANSFKVVFNHKRYEYNRLRLYLSEEFGFAKRQKNHNFKLGLTAVYNNVGSDNRIKIDQNRNLTFYTKFISKFKNYKVGLVGTFELSKKYIAQKSFYVGYNHKDVEFHFKADQTFGRRTMSYKNMKEWFSQVSLTTVIRVKPHLRIALQLVGLPQSNRASAAALLEHTTYTPKSGHLTMYKLKLNSSLTLAGLIRHQYNNKFVLSVGCKIPFYDRQEINKLGFRVDINV